MRSHRWRAAVTSLLAPTDEPLGASDCERMRDGFLSQPANALSAGTLAGFGLWLAHRHRRHHDHAELVGAIVAAAGLGSVAYHGPGSRLGAWAHDATIVAMLGVIALEDVREVRPDVSTAATAVYAAAMIGAGVLLAVRPETIRAVSAIVSASAFVAELSARRLVRDGTARAHRTAEALMAGAVTAYVAGRTGSPACRPNSMIQLHGLWHTLSGIAMIAWAHAALGEQ